MGRLSHIGPDGNAKMVDVSAKPLNVRTAVAAGKISLRKETVDLVRKNEISKGDVIATAKIAGIQAAKQTAPVASCMRKEINSLLRTPWDPVTRQDVKALVTAAGAEAQDFDSLAQQNALTFNDWDAQLQRDATQAGTAANIVRSDLGLPPNQ